MWPLSMIVRRLRHDGLRRPPIGAVWGWMQTVAGRTATDALLSGGALVLSPHQDDETIGCGLLIAEKTSRGIPVAVAVATDGGQGWYSAGPRPAPCDIAEIRHHEWHQALDRLGVNRVDRFELRFPDGELERHAGELADSLVDLLRRVRPSQVFVTRPGDPHPDHQTLAQAVGRAIGQMYGPDLREPERAVQADDTDPHPLRMRPQVLSYRVYPGEGLWPNGRPPSSSVGTVVMQLVRSGIGISGRRALLFRAPGSVATKMAAIEAYDSQRRLLGGELRSVWAKPVELYWPMA